MTHRLVKELTVNEASAARGRGVPVLSFETLQQNLCLVPQGGQKCLINLK